MNKQVILFKDDKTARVADFVECLNEAGIAVSMQELGAPAEPSEVDQSLPLLAVLYEIPPKSSLGALQAVVERAHKLWSGAPILGCRRRLADTTQFDNQTLKRIGFRAVADSPAQLPALLRQVEEVVTGELRLPQGFKSAPDSEAFSLPTAIGRRHLRGTFALLSSLHLASNQKEAAVAAVAGLARLVPAESWSIRLALPNRNTDEPKLELLVSRNFANPNQLKFDQEWQRELNDDSDTAGEPESRAAAEAATRVEPVRKIEKKNRIVALPLVSGERVIGVIEGARRSPGSKSFSRADVALLTALTLPIASALSNAVRIADAERLSLTDELTRLHNARYLRQFLVNEIKRARRYRSNLAALFLDLDDFKRVNDLYGHLAGSHALMEVAGVVLPSVRDTDCVVRYGGDEFVVVLPETGVEEAQRVAERIRAKIERHKFTGGRRLKITLTVSTGIAVFPQHALSPQQLIACADRAMYEAKAAHKNCIRVAVETPATAKENDPTGAGPIQPTQFQRIPDEKLIS
jgi:diguanylate cyclase (GGDEF)-like protein